MSPLQKSPEHGKGHRVGRGLMQKRRGLMQKRQSEHGLHAQAQDRAR